MQQLYVVEDKNNWLLANMKQVLQQEVNKPVQLQDLFSLCLTWKHLYVYERYHSKA